MTSSCNHVIDSVLQEYRMEWYLSKMWDISTFTECEFSQVPTHLHAYTHRQTREFWAMWYRQSYLQWQSAQGVPSMDLLSMIRIVT